MLLGVCMTQIPVSGILHRCRGAWVTPETKLVKLVLAWRRKLMALRVSMVGALKQRNAPLWWCASCMLNELPYVTVPLM